MFKVKHFLHLHSSFHYVLASFKYTNNLYIYLSNKKNKFLFFSHFMQLIITITTMTNTPTEL